MKDEMPDVIYVFPDPKSIGDMGFTVTNPDSTCSGVPYVQYHHSRIVEALQEENARLRDERKVLAEGIMKIHKDQEGDYDFLKFISHQQYILAKKVAGE